MSNKGQYKVTSHLITILALNPLKMIAKKVEGLLSTEAECGSIYISLQ